MPNCTKCGQPLKDGAMFCGQCGAAVRRCSNCGALLKEDAAFCGQCGAAANQVAPVSGVGVSASAPMPYPVAPQALGAQVWIRLSVINSDYVGFFGQWTSTVMVDGNAVRTVQMGETVDFAVPAGQHTIELVQVFNMFKIPITRKSDLEVNFVAGSQPIVVAEYSRFWGKFTLELR